jgi:hypothetical protein
MTKTSGWGDHRGLIAAVVTAALLLVGGGLVLRAVTAPGAPPQPGVGASSEPAATQAVPKGGRTPDTPGDAAGAKPPAAPPGRPTTSGATPGRDAADFGPLLAPSNPVALRIPSIGVDTKGLVSLHLDGSGRLEAPTDFDKAGWYAGGPTPGEFGPAVIGAHVDSKAGPAVFYELGALKKGAEVSVARQDGSTAIFVVDRVARYSKADFPTRTVYGDTGGRAELRLITCGGAFDRATGHYVDNIVAFAHLVG